MKTICEIKKAYSEQRRFDKDPENAKWKSAHREVFLDVEGGGDDLCGL